MGFRYRYGKIIGYFASPDEALDEASFTRESDKDGEDKYFSASDRLKYPGCGHIPGSVFGRDGKIVTNSGLRQTGWIPSDE